MGFVGVIRELTRYRDELLPRHAGNALLPGWRVRSVVIETAGSEFARQPACNAIVSHL